MMVPRRPLKGKRTPHCLLCPKTKVKTWKMIKTLNGEPDGLVLAYTAIEEFVGDHYYLRLLRRKKEKKRAVEWSGLATTQITD